MTRFGFLCFGGIQFNTALKLAIDSKDSQFCFGGIQFNTALKRSAQAAL